MKSLFLTLLLVSTSWGLFAQSFEVPKNYHLEKAGDYAPYEEEVLQCITWLADTPLEEEPLKRKEANAFLFAWLSGSPNVKIEIKQEIVTFMGSSPELLMAFMAGWAQHSLQTRNFKDKAAGNLAGIEAVLSFYTRNRAYLPKDKNVEKYLKMKEKGTLEEYVRKNA